MRRTFADACEWTEAGTKLITEAIRSWSEPEMSARSGLPGWTRKHLLAHLASNAEALRNLLHWAATGEKTPMYTSPEQRNADIESGGRMSAVRLGRWLHGSADRLAADMVALDYQHWQAEVVTAQGRTVRASEVAWMRAREVCVHAVDLDAGIGFAELPADFLAALVDDVVATRTTAPEIPLRLDATNAPASWELPGEGPALELAGPIGEIVAYLTGRPHALTTAYGAEAPRLGAWL